MLHLLCCSACVFTPTGLLAVLLEERTQNLSSIPHWVSVYLFSLTTIHAGHHFVVWFCVCVSVPAHTALHRLFFLLEPQFTRQTLGAFLLGYFYCILCVFMCVLSNWPSERGSLLVKQRQGTTHPTLGALSRGEVMECSALCTQNI